MNTVQTCLRCLRLIKPRESRFEFPEGSLHLRDCEPPKVFKLPRRARRLSLADKVEPRTKWTAAREALAWLALGVLVTTGALLVHHILVVAK